MSKPALPLGVRMVLTVFLLMAAGLGAPWKGLGVVAGGVLMFGLSREVMARAQQWRAARQEKRQDMERLREAMTKEVKKLSLKRRPPACQFESDCSWPECNCPIYR